LGWLVKWVGVVRGECYGVGRLGGSRCECGGRVVGVWCRSFHCVHRSIDRSNRIEWGRVDGWAMMMVVVVVETPKERKREEGSAPTYLGCGGEEHPRPHALRQALLCVGVLVLGGVVVGM
jgi:hypothetical protein